MTEEHDTVEDVSRDADADDEGIQVAKVYMFYGQESLKGDNVIGVVPRHKVVCVTIAFGVTIIHWNLHFRRHWYCDLAGVSPHRCYFVFWFVPVISNKRRKLVLSNASVDS